MALGSKPNTSPFICVFYIWFTRKQVGEPGYGCITFLSAIILLVCQLGVKQIQCKLNIRLRGNTEIILKYDRLNIKLN